MTKLYKEDKEMKKISNWVAGATLFMRYFSYICVWFAFAMALMSFDIQNTRRRLGCVCDWRCVYFNIYDHTSTKTANKIFGPVTGTEQKKIITQIGFTKGSAMTLLFFSPNLQFPI